MSDIDNVNDYEETEKGLADLARPRRRSVSDALSSMGQDDFLRFGKEHIVYIRRIVMNEHTLYGVFGADGTNLSLHESEDSAIGAAHENNLRPMQVY